MDKDISLLSLRLFVDVASSGSFSAAARLHGLPASSVSRRIARLETALGQRLLARSTRAVRLTEAGAEYLARVRAILEDLELATDQVGGGTSEPRGLLRINAPVAFGRAHIAPLLERFQEAHPKLEIELNLTDMFIDPVAEGADIVVRIGALRDSALVSRKLADQRHLVCAAPGYLDRHGAPADPGDLAGHNCLIYQSRQGAQAWMFRRGDDPFRRQEVTGNLKSNDALSLVEAARQGQGLVLFPSWLVHEHLRSGSLVPVLGDWQANEGSEALGIHLVLAERKLRSPKVEAFLAYLLKATGTPPHWDR